MATTSQRTDTPLGGIGKLYLEKKNSQGAIHLKPEEKTLELYPAGYTKNSSRDGNNRQAALKSLYEIAVNMGTQDMLYPFEEVPHNIKLVHQRNNPKDPYAMYVVIDAPVPGSMLGHLDGRDLGYVPLKVSEHVHKHGLIGGLITGGRILKIRANFHSKYYTCKVIFGYGDSPIGCSDFGQTTRFVDLVDEL